jgi:surfeit locus 1 family protein
MKKICFGPIVFRIALLPGIAFICLLPLLIALGIWQLGRAKEKEELLNVQNQRMHDSTLQLNAGSSADPAALRYRSVVVQGRYDAAQQFLIDNRVVNGRAGFYVLTPYKIRNSNHAVLVNRGWVPAGANRSVLPDVTIAEDKETVAGRINFFPVVGIKLTGAEIPSDGWPAVVQVVDSTVLSKRLGYTLLDFQVEMDPGEPNGYVREWKTGAELTPEKHLAYAFQWFGLALTLVILFVWLSCRRNTDE